METIYGNLQGLKPSQLKQLQRLYHQKQIGDRLTSADFAERLAAISTDIKQPICVYINRRGQVIRVGIGTPRQTQIPPLELPRYGAERLCGIRCIATQLKPDPPTVSSLTAMVLQRLDGLVTLTLTGSGKERRGGGRTGYVENAYFAHLLPHKDGNNEDIHEYCTVSEALTLESLNEQDFLAFVEGLEAEFQREFLGQKVDIEQDRVIIVGLQRQSTPEDQFQTQMQELSRLVDTAGGEVLTTLTQKRSASHPQTVVGKGKIQEIALQVQTLGANLVVFDHDLSPTQARNLENQLGVSVVDRTEVILDIFAQRAQSRAGKLQVELAQLEYKLPRLTGRGRAMSRLGGGIGTRGPGETKLETEKRTISRRISRLQQEVNQLQAHRSRLRQQRQDNDIPTIAIVGYTNAGKSTLINALTNSSVYTADQLFATLDPTTRRLSIPIPSTGEPKTVLLTDTVGFIHELPPSLVDAFRATLEEVTEADALLHVVDLSHPAWQQQITDVTEILDDILLFNEDILLAFNKIDRVEGETLDRAKMLFPKAVFMSASCRYGLETLRQRLGEIE